ncbi:hypothetical protein V2J94_38050 [Streptomyces sp. DSM 41524]|uniref:Uncharacterized protein n=1 Tax=Streptomyces asiaticus subsp. ignotus TaxID=3098222 RepID=A0ABU7Q892_9ACTN|nr:hypothetical protein [Streptomyces sp. DSM 41524]
MARAYDFPQDLLTVQKELHQVTATLTALLKGLPWSVEPHPGFNDPDIWRPRKRPATDGWPKEDQAEVRQLRNHQCELTTTVVTHPFWQTLEGPDVVTARMMLKHAHDAPADTPAA